MTDYIIVLVTASSRDEAETIAMQLINAELSPCVNIISQCLSVYQWKEEVRTDEEVLMLVKSRGSLFHALKTTIEKTHSYDVPEIVSIRLDDISDRYRAYLENFLGGSRTF